MEAQPQTPEPKRSNKTLLIIGGILIACCFLSIIIVLVYQFVIAPSISNTIQAISSTPQGNEAPSSGTGGSTSGNLPSGGRAGDSLWLQLHRLPQGRVSHKRPHTAQGSPRTSP